MIYNCQGCVGLNDVRDLTIINVSDLGEKKVEKQDTVEETAVPGDLGDTVLGEGEFLIFGED